MGAREELQGEGEVHRCRQRGELQGSVEVLGLSRGVLQEASAAQRQDVRSALAKEPPAHGFLKDWAAGHLASSYVTEVYRGCRRFPGLRGRREWAQGRSVRHRHLRPGLLRRAEF